MTDTLFQSSTTYLGMMYLEQRIGKESLLKAQIQRRICTQQL